MGDLQKPGQLDSWVSLSRLTPARIALGRVGVSVPTSATLDFAMAHARARDAIHAPLDVPGLVAEMEEAGFVTFPVTTRTASRAEYLLRPDLGRRLSSASRDEIVTDSDSARLTVVVADGLSSLAPRRHALPLLSELRSRLAEWELDTVFMATQARVALGDEIGELRGAEVSLVLIGERPGLQASDSLGAYLTYGPRVGRSDAERNCVSNIRPGGLGYGEAAEKLVRLLEGARRLGGSGVGLKDEGGLIEG